MTRARHRLTIEFNGNVSHTKYWRILALGWWLVAKLERLGIKPGEVDVHIEGV